MKKKKWQKPQVQILDTSETNDYACLKCGFIHDSESDCPKCKHKNLAS